MARTTTRNANLRQALSEHRRRMHDHVQERVRSGRDDRPTGSHDSVDASDATFQHEIDMALLQMQAATLVRIDEALVRIDADEYGFCCECDGKIAESRLKALPFAVRCRTCEEQRENVPGRARQAALRSQSPFSTATS